ncbi:hypothetical protein ABEB36_012045 [Hypothenemus hampei]|uniref:PDZ and LIM domain protein Zasp n=1 Tax=Hypothenemus hampei TaxID=57062 RepID=A0ABD1EBX0_HYPHA
MATLTTVRLNKGDSPTWGFRLQGGKDFGTPLVIQKVNGGSPAERAGLIAGDSVIKINNVDVFNLLHKEAQDVIVRAGSSFEMVIQRGGSTWKPTVVPTGSYAKPSPSINNVSAVTKTSLAAPRNDNIGSIGTGHNQAAKPFTPQVNGAVNGGPKLVNKQYNTPLKLYSEDAIAETISAQSEVLSTGALGVNFKKNEKNYDASNSAVYRMLQEAENDPGAQLNEPVLNRNTESHERRKESLHSLNDELKSDSHTESAVTICTDCERVIVGVFVRIKDKNLHVECFKCSTCGSSLKNVGYYNINNKLYCDVHAKSAAIAINNPAAVPITPSNRAPASAISTALSGHSLPSASPLSPKTSTYAPNYLPSAAPKPFSSVSGPLSPGGGSLPRPGPLSPSSNFNKAPLSPPTGHSYGSYSPASTAVPSTLATTNIIWPPLHEDTDIPTACPLFYPPPSKVEAELERKQAAKKTTQFEREYFSEEDVTMDETLSYYSEELSFTGRRSATECAELLSETLETQKLVENVISTVPKLPVPIQAPPIPPPPQPNEFGDLKRPTDYQPNTIECHLSNKIENSVPQKWESSLTQAIRTTAPDPDTFSRIPSRMAASPLASALSIAPAQPFTPLAHSILDPVPLPEETEPYFPPEHPIILREDINNNQKSTMEKPSIPKPYSPFVKALEIAPERPFTPVGGPTPTPPTVKKKPKDPLDKLLEELPKPNEKLDMRSALTTAPERPYTPLISDQVDPVKGQKKPEPRQDLIRPLKPEELPVSFKINTKEPKPPSYYAPCVLEERIRAETSESIESCESKETRIIEKETVQPGQVTQHFVATNQENQPVSSNFAPLFQGFSCSFKNKTDHSQFSIEVCTTPPVLSPPPKAQTPISYIATVEEKPACVTREKIIEEKRDSQQSLKKAETVTVEVKEIERQAEEVVQVKPIPVSMILRKPEALPGYQLDLKAIAEADLLLMERKKRAEERLRKEKEIQDQACTVKAQKMQEIPIKPVITIEGDSNYLSDERPPSQTFSPRPRSITPSMINKAPPLLPYYQDNLVAHYQPPTEANLFDPSQPQISRSPSPHPVKQRSRSPSPFPIRQERAKSPAEGPPANPLASSKPLPTPEDSRIRQAKDSLQTSLTHYKQQRDLIEQQRGLDFCRREDTQETQEDFSQNVAYPKEDVRTGKVQMQVQQLLQQQVDGSDRREVRVVAVPGGGMVKTDVSTKEDHLLACNKTQSHSTEISADGLVQVQRTKRVTEELEQSHKENNVQIITCTKPFAKVNVQSVEPPTSCQNFHITNPHHIKDTQKTLQQASQKLSEIQPPIPPPPQPPIRRVFPPGSLGPLKHVTPPRPSDNVTKPNIPNPDVGAGAGRQSGGVTAAPKRGRGLLNAAALPGSRVPLCGHCHGQIRGPFITALGKIWCPQHFVCATGSCRRPLQDLGFVEENGQLYCEYCFEQYLAPPCSKCNAKIKGDCLKAIGKNFHPECFNCFYCGKLFGNNPFFLEDGSPYCEADWNELFTTKCFACGFPVEAGDRWVEALNNNYHSQCFNCTMCKKNLEGQSFFAKGGRPFCKNHAR